jgi:hypothetical protein
MMENNYGKLQECSTEKRREGKGRRALSRRQGFLAPAKPSEKYRQAIQAQGGKVFSETF